MLNRAHSIILYFNGLFNWIFTSFSTLLVISGCLCHIILKWGVPVIALIINVAFSIKLSKDIESKLLQGFGQGFNPRPPSPKANTLAQNHGGWCI